MARRLRHPNIPRYHGREDFGRKVLSHLGRDFGRELRPRVEHREQQAGYLDVESQALAEYANRVERPRQALQRVVFALKRNDDAV